MIGWPAPRTEFHGSIGAGRAVRWISHCAGGQCPPYGCGLNVALEFDAELSGGGGGGLVD